MNDFYYFLISGAFLMMVPILVIVYFQAGFFTKWLKVRTGRGKYVLVKVRSALRDRFEVGIVQDGFLIYGKKENTRRSVLPKNMKSIYAAFGINVIDIDEETGAVCTVDYEAISGYDSEKFENLLVRALYKPPLDESKEKLILLAVLVAIAIGLVGLFLTWNVSQQIAALGSQGVINTVL